MYLLHRDVNYQPGLCPLALVWKDSSCSRYLLDTDSDGIVSEYQHVTLAFQPNSSFGTEDDPPIILGVASEEMKSQLGTRLKPGKLLRFTIRTGGIKMDNSRPVLADLQFEGFANQRRGRADSISKILFQYNARRGLINFNKLFDEVGKQQNQPSKSGRVDESMDDIEYID